MQLKVQEIKLQVKTFSDYQQIFASFVFLLLQTSLANITPEHQTNLENNAGLERTSLKVPYQKNDQFRRFREKIRVRRGIHKSNIAPGSSWKQQGWPMSARDPNGPAWRTRTMKRNNLHLRTPKKKATAAQAAPAAKPGTPAAPAAAAKPAVSPPAPSKTEAKKIKSAAKLLNSDAQKELKKENQDGQHAVKNLQNIQDKATTATEKATVKNTKNEAKTEANLQKDQAAVQKASTNPQGKKGAKAEAKAEAALNKDKTGLAKTQQDATKAMHKINDGETKALQNNEAKLDKGIKDAHSAQFNKEGVAKEHPTTWQKFKKVMGYIGTGILDVIPGTEAVGAAVTIARTAATLGVKVT